jgi:hypothetical protein
MTECDPSCTFNGHEGLREQATSGTEGEKGTELRPCDSVALTWLEIGAATREGCEQGKHQNCTGEAWDTEKDEPCACPCSLNRAGPHHLRATS